jgi:hypothetical protein
VECAGFSPHQRSSTAELSPFSVLTPQQGWCCSNQAAACYAVTPRVLDVRQLAAPPVSSCQPLLLVGVDGCGKSGCLQSLGWLMGAKMQRVTITPGRVRVRSELLRFMDVTVSRFACCNIDCCIRLL